MRPVPLGLWSMLTLIGYAATTNRVIIIFGLALLCAIELQEVIRTKRFATPRAVFTAGWMIPLLIAQIPLEKFYVFAASVPASANLLALTIICLFYAICALPLPALRRGRMWAPPVEPILCLYGLSIAGFAWALWNADLHLPFMADNPTEAAFEFLPSAPGAATLLSLGDIALLLSLLHWERNESSASPAQKATLVILGLSFLAAKFLIGKRMGIILAILAMICIVLTSGQWKPRLRHVAVGAVLVLILFTANAYIRNSHAFQEYYAGTGIVSADSVGEYTLFQMIAYVQPNFRNLGDLMAAPISGWQFQSVTDLSGGRIDAFGSTYEEVRSRSYNMVTFAGPLLAAGGIWSVMGYSALLFLLLQVLWRNAAYNTTGRLLYALIATRVVLLFAGNLTLEPVFLRELGALLLISAGVRITGSSSRHRDRSEGARGA